MIVGVETLKQAGTGDGFFNLPPQNQPWWQQTVVGTDFFGIPILVSVSGHMLCQGEDLHFERDGSLHHLFQRVRCMVAELSRVTMMRKRHSVVE